MQVKTLSLSIAETDNTSRGDVAAVHVVETHSLHAVPRETHSASGERERLWLSWVIATIVLLLANRVIGVYR